MPALSQAVKHTYFAIISAIKRDMYHSINGDPQTLTGFIHSRAEVALLLNLSIFSLSQRAIVTLISSDGKITNNKLFIAFNNREFRIFYLQNLISIFKKNVESLIIIYLISSMIHRIISYKTDIVSRRTMLKF